MDQKSSIKHQHPDDIERDIYETQSSLEGNLKQLEDILQQSLSESFHELSNRIQSTKEHIKGVATSIKEPVKKAFDIPGNAQRAPYLTVCGAFAAGAILAVRSKVERKTTQARSNTDSKALQIAKEVALHTTKTILNVQIEKYLRTVMEAKSGGSDGT